MIQYFISVGLILLVVIIYKMIIAPRKLYYFYLNKLRQMGYKVYATPFIPFGIPLYKLISNDEKQGDSLKICKTIYREHDVILTNSLHKIVLDFTHPDFIKYFYSVQHLYIYPKLKFQVEPIVRAMGRGIPFSQGQQWKRKRKIINTVFNFDFIKSMIPKIEKVCEKGIIDVQSTVSPSYQNGYKIIQYDIIDLTVRMFSNVVLECFFGGSTDEKIQGKPVCIFMNQLIADVTKNSFQILPMLLGSKFVSAGIRKKDRDVNRRIKLFKQWGLKFIKSKIQIVRKKYAIEGFKGEPQDMIQALLRANQSSESKNQSEIYTQQEILEQFSTFFVAGTDTTSHYVMTMIYYIAQNGDVQSKLRKTIDEIMKDDDYSFQNLKKLVYIDWIQKQTSRMYGPITGIFMRGAQKDNLLNGLPVKKGTYVSLQHLGNHYSEKYFKDPLIFRPERWEKQCDSIPNFALGGFSAGPRTCIGKHLVGIQSKIGLVKFMKRYKKIIIPSEPLKWTIKFVYTPEYFKSKLVINQ